MRSVTRIFNFERRTLTVKVTVALTALCGQHNNNASKQLKCNAARQHKAKIRKIPEKQNNCCNCINNNNIE